MSKHEELNILAAAAPGGPWIAENDSLYFKDDGYTRHLLDADAGHDVEETAYYAALKFIAAANPAAVLALIAENEELSKDAARYRWMCVEGNWVARFHGKWRAHVGEYGDKSPTDWYPSRGEAIDAAMAAGVTT